MRVFQRAFRRGGILIRHSQGFTPRPCLHRPAPSRGPGERVRASGLRFGAGVVIPLEEIPARLNATLPSGLHVLAAWPEGRKLRELTHLDAALTLGMTGASFRWGSSNGSLFSVRTRPCRFPSGPKAA